MVSLFFSKQGKRIICGTTTSTIAAKYLGNPMKAKLVSDTPGMPPTTELKGIALVT